MFTYRIFSLIALISCLLILSSCKERILHEIDESQANQARLVLSRSGISTYKVKEGALWSIDVPSSAAARALSMLEHHRVIKRDVIIRETKSNNLIQSSEEKSFYLERALSGNLEQTIERFPYVLEARVHISRQPKEVFTISTSKRVESASVLIIVEDENVFNADKIKKLVAGAAGIEVESVSVIVEVAELETIHARVSAQDIQSQLAPKQSADNLEHKIRNTSWDYIYYDRSVALLVMVVALSAMLFLSLRILTRPSPNKKEKLKPQLLNRQGRFSLSPAISSADVLE